MNSPPKIRTSSASQEGDTPLHIAAESGHAEVVDRLIMAKAQVNSKTQVLAARAHGGMAIGILLTIPLFSIQPRHDQGCKLRLNHYAFHSRPLPLLYPTIRNQHGPSFDQPLLGPSYALSLLLHPEHSRSSVAQLQTAAADALGPVVPTKQQCGIHTSAASANAES